MNSVALHIKLTSHKPQQTFIHCNTVPTGKYLTFNKTKYGENTIVSQMTENKINKTSYVTSVTMQFARNPCYMSQMSVH